MSIASTFAPITEALSTEHVQRAVLGNIAGFFVSYGVTTLTISLLAAYIGWLLAALLAVIAGVTLGFLATEAVATTGYDHAVHACAWLKSRFTK